MHDSEISLSTSYLRDGVLKLTGALRSGGVVIPGRGVFLPLLETSKAGVLTMGSARYDIMSWSWQKEY